MIQELIALLLGVLYPTGEPNTEESEQSEYKPAEHENGRDNR